MLVDATNGVTAIGGVVIDGATKTATDLAKMAGRPRRAL